VTDSSETPSAGSVGAVWHRLREHKVLQWGLAYIGVALAIAHGAELMSSAFEWPHVVGRVVILLLLLGLPLVVTLAWYHGHRHLKNFSAPELTITALLVVLLGGTFVLLVHGPAESVASAASTADPTLKAARAGKPRLAILPFENLSPDPANAFFTDGLHEEILTSLANSSKALEVISRTTMMIYRSAPKPVAEIAKELGATHVLEGSVRREGQDVRLTLQLIDARTDEHVWAQNYDRTLVKAMTLQSQVAEEVATQLAVQLTGTDHAAAPMTNDPIAHDLYLKAHLAAETLTFFEPIGRWRTIEQLFGAAIERDPNFAAAYVERFGLRVNLFNLNYDTSEETRRAARADLDAAERLRPKDPAWLAPEARWASLNQENPRALALFAEADVAGAMNSEATLARSEAMGRMGSYQDALPLLERATELDPANASLVNYRGVVLAYSRRPADALRVIQMAIDRVPDFEPPGRIVQQYIRYVFTGDSRLRKEIGANLEPQVGDDEATWRDAYSRQPEEIPMQAWGMLLPQAVGHFPARAMTLGAFAFAHGHREQAAEQGRAILQFVSRQTQTRFNQWFLNVLTAFAKMYLGDKPGAVAAAREAIRLAPRNTDAVHAVIASAAAIPILAWAGHQDEAFAMLEPLTTSDPGLMPGEFATNAVYATAFGENARFKALVARFKAQMAATKLE